MKLLPQTVITQRETKRNGRYEHTEIELLGLRIKRVIGYTQEWCDVLPTEAFPHRVGFMIQHSIGYARAAQYVMYCDEKRYMHITQRYSALTLQNVVALGVMMAETQQLPHLPTLRQLYAAVTSQHWRNTTMIRLRADIGKPEPFARADGTLPPRPQKGSRRQPDGTFRMPTAEELAAEAAAKEAAKAAKIAAKEFARKAKEAREAEKLAANPKRKYYSAKRNLKKNKTREKTS